MSAAKLTTLIKDLKSMDKWPASCPPANTLCHNYRGNIKRYEKQLAHMKKNGPITHLKLSNKELQTLLSGQEFISILNEMVALSSAKLRLKFTSNSIQIVEKVSKAFIAKHIIAPDTGPIYRIRCKCRVFTNSKASTIRPKSSINIFNCLEVFKWRLNDNIGKRLADRVSSKVHGDFNFIGRQIVQHGQEPGLYGPLVITTGPGFDIP